VNEGAGGVGKMTNPFANPHGSKPPLREDNPTYVAIVLCWNRL